MSRTDKCYLVEGYTDVLSMHQAGIENVVASSGTALTPDQIRLVKRFTPNITIIYDGDQAGIKASLRGIDLVLEEGMNVKVLLLPDGEDPDSFAKKMGASGYLEYIEKNETDFIQFKTRLLLKSTENDPIAKARLISDVIGSVAVIPDTITRSVYIKECSRLLGVDEQVLYTEIRKQKFKQSEDFQKKEMRERAQKPAAPKAPAPTPEAVSTRMLIEEKEFLRFMLKHCKTELFEAEDEETKETVLISVGEYMVDELEGDDLVSDNKMFQKIFYEVRDNIDNKDFDPWKHFIYHPESQVSKFASDLVSEKHQESKLWKKSGAFTENEDEILDLLVPKIVSEYKLRKIKLMMIDIEKALDNVSASNDFDKIIELQSTYMNLKRAEKELAESLGSRTIN
jgi:DNA primase